MFRRILVPLDGSYRAEQAIPVAARLARANGGVVSLLQVITHSIDASGYMVQTPMLTERAIEDDFAAANEYLKIIAGSSELRGLTVEREVSSGSPAEVILYDATSHPVDMIVMCSHGRTGFTRWMLGSVAQQVARHSVVPVLILREPVVLHEKGIATRVLVALDGSPLAEAVLEAAAYLSASLSAPAPGELHLLRVLHDLSSNERTPAGELITNGEHQEVIAGVEAYLAGLEQRLLAGEVGKLHLKITSSVARDMDVAGQIVSMAERGEDAQHLQPPRSYDVIAMATHGRSAITRLMLGSVTERVLSVSKLPLLIVRPAPIKATHKQASEPVAKATGEARPTHEAQSWVGLL